LGSTAGGNQKGARFDCSGLKHAWLIAMYHIVYAAQGLKKLWFNRLSCVKRFDGALNISFG